MVESRRQYTTAKQSHLFGEGFLRPWSPVISDEAAYPTSYCVVDSIDRRGGLSTARRAPPLWRGTSDVSRLISRSGLRELKFLYRPAPESPPEQIHPGSAGSIFCVIHIAACSNELTPYTYRNRLHSHGTLTTRSKDRDMLSQMLPLPYSTLGGGDVVETRERKKNVIRWTFLIITTWDIDRGNFTML